MAARRTAIFLLVLHIGLSAGAKQPPDNRVEDLELTRVTREVDLTSPLAKQKVSMVVENKGTKPVTSVLYMVEPQLTDKVAFISAQVLVSSSEEKQLWYNS